VPPNTRFEWNGEHVTERTSDYPVIRCISKTPEGFISRKRANLRMENKLGSFQEVEIPHCNDAIGLV